MDYSFRSATAPEGLRGWLHRIVVHDFEAVLLYRHGRRLGRLGTGQHRRWGRGYAVIRLDLRQQTLTVAGQEVLSADSVGLKVSTLATFRVDSPERLVDAAQDWLTQLHLRIQVALRTAVAARPLEALLQDRLALGSELLAAVQPEATRLGLALEAVEVKDVMIPGDLKRVFGGVLRARQEGLAALERARGESAALRNLANAARLLEGNPALQNLRLLHSLTTAGSATPTLVMGMPGGFVPLPGTPTTPAAG